MGFFQGQWKQMVKVVTYWLNEYNIKYPNWQETDQLGIYKCEQETELGTTMPTSGQNGTWTNDFRISSPLCHTATRWSNNNIDILESLMGKMMYFCWTFLSLGFWT